MYQMSMQHASYRLYMKGLDPASCPHMSHSEQCILAFVDQCLVNGPYKVIANKLLSRL